MQRVQGIGGLFFKAADKRALLEWYRINLGIDVQDWGGAVLNWREMNPRGTAATHWSIFSDDTTYFSPGTATFMVNFRVDDLSAMLAQLRANGCQVEDKVDESEYGRFGWVVDPEGNKIELWEPPT